MYGLKCVLLAEVNIKIYIQYICLYNLVYITVPVFQKTSETFSSAKIVFYHFISIVTGHLQVL